MSKKVSIYASLLSADFGRLEEETKRIEEAQVDAIHIDIMDGHFVPNLTLGPKAVRAVRKATKLPLDVHLMMYNPFDFVERFVEAGADMISFHVEATEEVEEVLQYIRKCNVKAALALNPETSASLIVPYLAYCDAVLFMTVNPGFGGQQLVPDVLLKIQEIKDLYLRVSKAKELPFDIQVDGGINPETAKMCLKAGANVLISGNYLFSESSLLQGVVKLKNLEY